MASETPPQDGFGSDSFFFTEAARGGPWVWRVGSDKFDGEPLGPVRHAHDDAGEYYYMYRGSAHVETGGVEFVLEEGELGYIPSDAPHNFTGPASDEDAWFFCVIAPNFAENKWRVSNFKPGSEDLRMEVAVPFVDEDLPGGDHLSAKAVDLSPGGTQIELTPAGFEIAYLVVDGSVDFSLHGGLGGSIRAGTFIHIRDGMTHSLSSTAGGKALRFDCRFDAWSGIETAEDVA